MPAAVVAALVLSPLRIFVVTFGDYVREVRILFARVFGRKFTVTI